MSVAGGACEIAVRAPPRIATRHPTERRMSTTPLLTWRSLQFDEHRTLLDCRAGTRQHGLDAPGRRRAQLVLHLHRFHHDESLPRLNLIAGLRVHSDDESRHRRNQWGRSGWSGALARELADRAGAFIQR